MMTTEIDWQQPLVELDWLQSEHVARVYLLNCFELEKAYDNDKKKLKAYRKVIKDITPASDWEFLKEKLTIEEKITDTYMD
jgi:hypothetical protein